MRIVLTGATGQLGSYLLEELVGAGHRVIAWSRRAGGQSDCGLPIRPVEPDRRADRPRGPGRSRARRDPSCRGDQHGGRGQKRSRQGTRRQCRGNSNAGQVVPRPRAAACASHRPIWSSTARGSWYREEDEPRPILAYGRTKAEAESAVLDLPGGLVARLSLLYGPTHSGRQSFFERAMAGFRAGQPQSFFSDEYRTPLDYKSAARLLARLAAANVQGVVHVAGRERLSRFELMSRIAASLGIDPALVPGQPHGRRRPGRAQAGRRLAGHLASCLAPARRGTSPSRDRDP